jgi:two-component system sensor histidine kinase UhpB
MAGIVPMASRQPPAFKPGDSTGGYAGARDHRLALSVGALLLAALAVTAPFARVQWAAVPAFVSAHDTAVIVLQSITAWLVYALYRRTGSVALLPLLSGSTFMLIVVAAHALSFPDAFVTGSLIGTAQTSAWLRMGWHGVFPVSVAAYALLRSREAAGPAATDRHGRRAVMALATPLCLALAVVALATRSASSLPPLMGGGRYLPAAHWALMAGWMAHLVALGLLLWATRGRRVLDLWLALGVLATLVDLALSATFTSGHFQAGFYLGRVYGLLGSGFVLFALLRESVAAPAAGATARAEEDDPLERRGEGEALRQAHAQLEQRIAERTAALNAEVAERRAAENRSKALLGRLMSVQEEERRRIARDIHDHIGQQITALRMNLESIRATASHDARLAAAAERAARVAEELDLSIDSLTRELRPAALDHLGLTAALENLVRGWSERFGVPVEFRNAVNDGPRLSADGEANLYRIAQEALHNVYKHAGASVVRVTLSRADGHVQLVIQDDGRGFSPVDVHQASIGGLGLESMRERASLIGGQFVVRSAFAHGTTVTVRVPEATETM